MQDRNNTGAGRSQQPNGFSKLSYLVDISPHGAQYTNGTYTWSPSPSSSRLLLAGLDFPSDLTIAAAEGAVRASLVRAGLSAGSLQLGTDIICFPAPYDNRSPGQYCLVELSAEEAASLVKQQTTLELPIRKDQQSYIGQPAVFPWPGTSPLPTAEKHKMNLIVQSEAFLGKTSTEVNIIIMEAANAVYLQTQTTSAGIAHDKIMEYADAMQLDLYRTRKYEQLDKATVTVGDPLYKQVLLSTVAPGQTIPGVLQLATRQFRAGIKLTFYDTGGDKPGNPETQVWVKPESVQQYAATSRSTAVEQLRQSNAALLTPAEVIKFCSDFKQGMMKLGQFMFMDPTAEQVVLKAPGRSGGSTFIQAGLLVDLFSANVVAKACALGVRLPNGMYVACAPHKDAAAAHPMQQQQQLFGGWGANNRGRKKGRGFGRGGHR
jgi:hypothetical protein